MKSKEWHEVTDYPKDAICLARRRCRGLLHVNILTFSSIERLVMSAYLQGLVDAAETMGPKIEEQNK